MTSALTIGTFDGVHLGHAALVARCKAFARASGGRAIVLAFDPHPLTTLAPARAPLRLTSFTDKETLLRAAGADEVVRLLPEPQFLSQTGEDFARWMIRHYGAGLIVEGGDFRFGKDRKGDAELLRRVGSESACAVEVLPPVEVTLTDHSIVRASSTLVRWLLRQGRVRDAAIVLGRGYVYAGEVVRGDRLGRTLDIPTANLDADACPLGLGAYAAIARLHDASGAVHTFPAAVNVGVRPSVGGVRPRVEAHLLGAGGAGRPILPDLPEYGWRLSLEFRSYIRDEMRFGSLDALRAQVARDVQKVREVIARDADGLWATIGARTPERQKAGTT